jgi:uncharacterized protein YlxP (DUF503 family)
MIATLTLELRIEHSQSLKDKRQVVLPKLRVVIGYNSHGSPP